MVTQKVLVLETELGVWTVRVKRGGELIVEEYRATRGTRIDIPASEFDAMVAASDPVELAAEQPSMIAKAKQWLAAEASQIIHGSLDDDAFNERMNHCKSCQHLDARPSPQIGFCTRCGCGHNSRAELTVKGRMPGATCPLSIWAATR